MHGMQGGQIQGLAWSQPSVSKLWVDLTTISLPKVGSELESRPLNFPFTSPLIHEEIARHNPEWLVGKPNWIIWDGEGKWEGLPELGFLLVQVMLRGYLHIANKNISYHLFHAGNPDTCSCAAGGFLKCFHSSLLSGFLLQFTMETRLLSPRRLSFISLHVHLCPISGEKAMLPIFPWV